MFDERWDDYFAREDSIRERYWRELEDVKREAEISRDEAAYEAMMLWQSLPLGLRLALGLIEGAGAAADCIADALVLPVDDEDDIPF